MHACMHEPLASESAVWWRGEGWVDPVVDIGVFTGYEGVSQAPCSLGFASLGLSQTC